MLEQCGKQLLEEYQKLQPENLEVLKAHEEKNPSCAILVLLSDYEAYKELLIQEEYVLETAQVDYENNLTMLKATYMKEGMKSTEAKENSKRALTDKYLDLLELERRIKILKACINSTEYQLRLKFLELKEQLILRGEDD